MTTPSLQPRPSLGITLLLSLLLGFASISTDLYIPAMPAMQHSLGASQGQLELTVSAYLLGFSLGQLFWGPISDRIGRRLPLILGVSVFAVGAAGCALAGDASQLIAFRSVQALGASAAVVLGRAMVRDLFERDDAARMLSKLMLIMSIAPMVGPSVGAQILAHSSWRAIFWALVGLGLLTLICLLRTRETHPTGARTDQGLGQAFATYSEHLTTPLLVAYAGILACSGAGVFAYVAGSSFAFIDHFGLSPTTFGLVFASSILGIMLANAANLRLVTRVGSDRMLLLGSIAAAVAGSAAILTATLGWAGWLGLAATLFAYIGANTLIGANAIAGGLSAVRHGTGTASALLGCAQYGGGLVGSALVGLFADGTPITMAVVIGTTSLVAALLAVAVGMRWIAAARPG